MTHPDAHGLAGSQIDRYLMERRLRHSPKKEPVKETPTSRPVITLSSTRGVPVKQIAERVASELGFHVIDREVLKSIQHDTQLGERIIASLDEGSRSTLDAWIAGWVDYDSPVVDVRNFHHMLSRIVRGISLHGEAVMVGRGAGFALRGTQAYRVRITAPEDLRAAALIAERAASGHGLSLTEARKELEADAARQQSFVHTYFRMNINDPEVYDAIFNLRNLKPELGAGLILDGYARVIGS
jgi:cytidylate kinase